MITINVIGATVSFIYHPYILHQMIIQFMLQSDKGRKTINHNFTSMSFYTMRRDHGDVTAIMLWWSYDDNDDRTIQTWGWLAFSGNMFVMWRDALAIHLRCVCALFYFDWSSLVRCTCVPRTCIARRLACFYIWTVTNNGDLGLISTQISITPWDVATIVLRQKYTTKSSLLGVFLSYDLFVTEALGLS